MLLPLVAISAACCCVAPYYHHPAGVAIVRCARSDAVKVGGVPPLQHQRPVSFCNHQLLRCPTAKAQVSGVLKAS